MHGATLLFCFAIITITAVSARNDDPRTTMLTKLAEMKKFFNEDELGMQMKELGDTFCEVMAKDGKESLLKTMKKNTYKRMDDELGANEEKTPPFAMLMKPWKKLQTFFQEDKLGMKMVETRQKMWELMCSIQQRMREQLKLKLKELLKEE
ncbi:unnamed protein product [Dibothriocephalus latus]|uniref:Uncharacterized protein n=1 Tax=Dibothriocephalus latus TaxID=60516 RepID=A0A3P7NPP7_DIBLA|nr:unnamed protein product [Dibothriocephalus latus]